jgi:hypothetical protein
MFYRGMAGTEGAPLAWIEFWEECFWGAARLFRRRSGCRFGGGTGKGEGNDMLVSAVAQPSLAANPATRMGHPAGAKAPLILVTLSARLKSCPVTKPVRASFSAPSKARTDSIAFIAGDESPAYPDAELFLQIVKSWSVTGYIYRDGGSHGLLHDLDGRLSGGHRSRCDG